MTWPTAEVDQLSGVKVVNFQWYLTITEWHFQWRPNDYNCAKMKGSTRKIPFISWFMSICPENFDAAIVRPNVLRITLARLPQQIPWVAKNTGHRSARTRNTHTGMHNAQPTQVLQPSGLAKSQKNFITHDKLLNLKATKTSHISSQAIVTSQGWQLNVHMSPHIGPNPKHLVKRLVNFTGTVPLLIGSVTLMFQQFNIRHVISFKIVVTYTGPNGRQNSPVRHFCFHCSWFCLHQAVHPPVSRANCGHKFQVTLRHLNTKEKLVFRNILLSNESSGWPGFVDGQ